MSKQKWEDSSLQKKKIYNGVASEYDMPTNNVEVLGRRQYLTTEQYRKKAQEAGEGLAKMVNEIIQERAKYKEVIEEVNNIIKMKKRTLGYDTNDSYLRSIEEILDKVKGEIK